jgi:hypothetical protein
MPRDFRLLASWFHVAGDTENRDVALDLIADMLAGASVMPA